MIRNLILILAVIAQEVKNLTDEALMLRFGKGDNSAFEELLNRYEKRIFCFIRRYVFDDQTASDLLQETFMRVIGAAERYEVSARFSTWVIRIARNLCTDYARRKRLEKMTSSTSSVQQSIDILVAPTPTGDQAVHNQEIRIHLDAAIKQLPEKQREVFVLRQMLDLSFKEIASIVDSSENTVKSRMRYALESLRLELHGFYHQGAAVKEGGGQ